MKIALLTDDSQCKIGLEVGGLGRCYMAYLTFHIFTKLKQLLIFQKVLNPGWLAPMCIVSLFVVTALGCFLRRKFILSYQNLRRWKQMVKLILKC